jgi:hypothetical protein
VAHTTARATEPCGPASIIWPRAILEPPFKCRQRGLAGELLLERLGARGPIIGFDPKCYPKCYPK